MARKIRKLYPLFIVVGGILIMMLMVLSRKKPERNNIQYAGALVDVILAEKSSQTVLIQGYGSVSPRYQVAIQPQVAGKVVWVDPDLVAGGSFEKGELMARIERVDYELALKQAEATVAQAQYQLDLSKANAGIAQREWEMMNSSNLFFDEDSSMSTPDPLVLYEPQLKQAEAAYKSAQSSLESAKLNLSRTEIRAPYNCKVSMVNISPGQIVSSAVSVAQVYATDLVEIFVSLPQADLEWIPIPGAKANVKLNTGSDYFSWDGEINRSVGVLDEIGRLEQVVVRVKNPFDNPEKPDLSIGSFVNVTIEGITLDDVIAIPRTSLRENNTVWLADGNKLVIRKVDVLKLTPDLALLRNGVEIGDKIVTTSLSGASNGALLRIKDSSEAPNDNQEGEIQEIKAGFFFPAIFLLLGMISLAFNRFQAMIAIRSREESR